MTPFKNNHKFIKFDGHNTSDYLKAQGFLT